VPADARPWDLWLPLTAKSKIAQQFYKAQVNYRKRLNFASWWTSLRVKMTSPLFYKCGTIATEHAGDVPMLYTILRDVVGALVLNFS